MFKKIINFSTSFSFDEILLKTGIKPIKFFIDSNFREKVIPIEGSVIYSNLYGAVEHSGIYIGNNEISNIIAHGFRSTVMISTPENFTDKGYLYEQIYVSCNSEGPVGNNDVAHEAGIRIGENGFYGLIFKNCHEFSKKCVNYSKENHTFKNSSDFNDIDETWEPTIKILKARSRKKIGATKWKLWDWKNTTDEKKQKTPNIKEIEKFWKNIILNENNMNILKQELNSCYDYIQEVSDENLPKEAKDLLINFTNNLKEIDKKYEEVKTFIKETNCEYSYHEFQEMSEDFLSLAKEIENNKKIQNVIKKLGRNYISKEKKLRPKVLKRSNNEVLGIHKSDDIMRILTSEMTNFESEELEYLFYSKFFEKSLLTYEIKSKESEYTSKQKEEIVVEKNKGPIVACLDTSGSMNGIPILKAKALLLAISKILNKENRSLYIILFGDKNQLKELNIIKKEDNKKIIPFLNNGFNGGTDFETPLSKGIEIIKNKKDYTKADILMITDGFCSLSNDFTKILNQNKRELDFSIYTIICNHNKIQDNYSDEIINL